jgi:glycosyltransferase involved in cell wall biosynthesis
MRIALLAPLPPERTGIADYAARFAAALESAGTEVMTPLKGCGQDFARIDTCIETFDWEQVNIVHAELGGGRLGEFHALRRLQDLHPELPLTATVHDPERLVWKDTAPPWPLSLLASLPRPFPHLATLLADPLTLRKERQLARHMQRLVTLTEQGRGALVRRMRLTAEKVTVIPHGNPELPAPLPAPDPLRLLYFGYIYRGKGIEDLLDALARTFHRHPALRARVRLTLAGGTAPDSTFGARGNYLDELRQRVCRLGLDDCMDWQLDLPEADIAQTIQSHHVMVLPYRESRKLRLLGEMRSTSGALSWASACGRGVICSDARAFSEEVSRGNGATYQQGDIDALAACIEQLAMQPDLAEQWSASAMRIGRDRAWPATARRFQQLYKSLSGFRDATR